MLACFPTVGTGYTFSRAWHRLHFFFRAWRRLHILQHLTPVTYFPALSPVVAGRGTIFPRFSPVSLSRFCKFPLLCSLHWLHVFPGFHSNQIFPRFATVDCSPCLASITLFRCLTQGFPCLGVPVNWLIRLFVPCNIKQV